MREWARFCLFLLVVQIALILLKVMGVLHLGWLLVLLPLWVYQGMLIPAMIAIYLFEG